MDDAARPITALLDEMWTTNVIRIMLAANCILTNILLLLVFCRFRNRLLTQCNVVIAFLAVGDIVIGRAI